MFSNIMKEKMFSRVAVCKGTRDELLSLTRGLEGDASPASRPGRLDSGKEHPGVH